MSKALLKKTFYVVVRCPRHKTSLFLSISITVTVTVTIFRFTYLPTYLLTLLSEVWLCKPLLTNVATNLTNVPTLPTGQP